MLISAQRIDDLLVSCLYSEDEFVDGEPIVPYVVTDGVMERQFGLHPDRLQSIKLEIEEMISNLPTEIDSIEGLSFLNVCQDKQGNLWTGMHRTCDRLIMLGIALDLLEYTSARPLWVINPGGMPMIRKKHPSDPNYKDMSKYRNGRERSQVVQTWLKEYKEPFMKGLLGEAKTDEEILTALRWGMNLTDNAEIASAVTNFTILWLESDAGREFIGKAFDIETPALKRVPAELSEQGKKAFKEILNKDPEQATVSQLSRVWEEDHRQNVMNNVIFRTDANRESISEETWKKVNFGSPETAEIVADTVIGWLNSPVGRTFVRDAFEVNIPTTDPKGSE